MLKNSELKPLPALVGGATALPRNDPSAAPSTTPAKSPIRPLLLHPWATLLVFLCAIGAGLPVVLKRAQPLYYANSLIYVSPSLNPTMREDNGQQLPYDNYMQQQMLTITRYDIVEKAVQKSRAEGLALTGLIPGPADSENDDQGVIERLRKAIEVTRTANGYQLSIGLHAKTKKDLAAAVNAVTNTYLDEMRSEEFYRQDHRIATLQASREKLQHELDAVLANPPASGSSGERRVAGNSARAALQSRLNEAHIERAAAEAQLKLYQSDVSLLRSAAEAQVTSAPVPPQKNEALQHRWIELSGLLAAMKPGYPSYGTIADEIKHTESAITADMEQKEAQLQQQQEQQISKLSTQILAKARLEVARLKSIEAEIERETNDLPLDNTAATEQEQPAPQARGLDEIVHADSLRAEIKAIDDRLSYFRIEGKSPSFLKLITPARTPLNPEKESRNKYLMALFAAAVAMSVSSAFLLELLSKKIKAISDIEEIIGFSPFGILLVKNFRNQHFADEHVTRIVNKIEMIAKIPAAKQVMLFTAASAASRDRDLTAKISHALRARGVSSAVVRADGHEIVRRDPVSTAGRTLLIESDAGARSRALTEFSAKLDELARDHDVILVEALPLLVSAETEYLAGLASIVFLTVEAGRTTKGELKRSAALLEKLNPAGVGVICHNLSLNSRDPQLKKSFREYEACGFRPAL